MPVVHAAMIAEDGSAALVELSRHHYDLVLNTDRLAPGACLEMVLLALLEVPGGLRPEPARAAHSG